MQSNKFVSEDTEVFADIEAFVAAEVSDREAFTVAVPVFMADITERTAFIKTISSINLL